VAEISNRSIALGKPIKKHIQELRSKKTHDDTLITKFLKEKEEASNDSKKTNMPQALSTTKSFTKQGNV